MNLLHFVPRESWPLNTGARLRNYHLARELSRRARVTFLGFADDGEQAANKAAHPTPDNQHSQTADASGRQSRAAASTQPDLERPLEKPADFYERVITVSRDKGYTPAKIIRGALGRTPLPVLNYTTDAMKRELAQALDAHQFEIVQVESVHLANYLPIIRAARSRPLVICDWHNIESELMRRYSEHAPTILHRAYSRKTSGQLAALELHVLREFDAHLVVSDRERDKLLNLAPEARVFLIENGVDTGYYSDERIRQAHARWLAGRVPDAESTAAEAGTASGSDSSWANRILFVGSMDYHANVDGVVDFARNVWPLLRREKPDLIFTIVGRDPAPEVRRLVEIPGIEVTGTVEDVRPYYYEAQAAVIPLRVGGGSRLKILEAMAAGVPVVSTRLGAEGIEARSGESIVLTETNEDLRAALIELTGNDERRRKLATAARALACARYDWAQLGASLVEIYEQLLAEREARGAKSIAH